MKDQHVKFGWNFQGDSIEGFLKMYDAFIEENGERYSCGFSKLKDDGSLFGVKDRAYYSLDDDSFYASTRDFYAFYLYLKDHLSNRGKK